MAQSASSAGLQELWTRPLGQYLLYRNSDDETRLLQRLSELICNPSHSANNRHKACHAIRCILQSGPFPPFSQLIQNGVLTSLIQLIDQEDISIKTEAVYMIGLFAQSDSREHTDAVVQAGAVPQIMKLVNGRNESLSILAIDSLGLLLRRHPELQGIRDDLWDPLLTLSSGFLLPTDCLFLSRTLNTFFSYPLQLTTHMAGQVLETIWTFLQSNNQLVIAAQFRIFSLVSQHEIGDVNPELLSRLCAKVVEMTRHESYQVFLPALNAVTGIIDDSVERNANVRNLLIDGMFEDVTLERMVFIIGGEYDKGVKHAACLTLKFLSKISNDIQLQALIASQAITFLVPLYRNADNSIKVEVASVMLNVTNRATTGDVKELTGALIEPLFGMLDREDEFALSCLRGIFRISVLWQRTTRDRTAYRRKLDRIGGEDKLMLLRDRLGGRPAWAADLIWQISYLLR